MVLSYELIGRLTVSVLLAVSILGVSFVVFVALDVVTNRVLTFLINLMWRGYSIRGEHPPDWRRKIAIVLSGVKYGDLHRTREKLRELEKLENKKDE